MKKLTICLIMMLLCSFMTVAAEDEVNSAPTDDILVVVNGELIEFDTPPLIEDDRTFIPVRAVAEFLNYDVSWDDATKTVKITDKDSILTMTIWKTDYELNGEKKQMDAVPFIKDDRTLVPIRLIAESFGCEVDWSEEGQAVIIKKYNKVTVSSAEEFLESIGDYTQITLSEGVYNLSEVDEVKNKNVKKSDVYDGSEYVVEAVGELLIKAADGAEVTIVTEPRYANVLTFDSCFGITVDGITAGHTIDKGSCSGGVIRFLDSSHALIKNCKLYGCGTYGIIGDLSAFIDVENTEIYECTYGGVSLYNCDGITFDSCIVRDCEGFGLFNFDECSYINIVNSEIKNNTCEDSELIFASSCEDVEFENCKFTNNTYDKFCENMGVSFENCEFDK